MLCHNLVYLCLNNILVNNNIINGLFYFLKNNSYLNKLKLKHIKKHKKLFCSSDIFRYVLDDDASDVEDFNDFVDFIDISVLFKSEKNFV